MVDEAILALLTAVLATNIMIMTTAAASTFATAAMTKALGIAPGAPPESYLLDALVSSPLPVLIMVIMQTGSQVAIMKFMLEINLILNVATM
jgi:hypothetical protein